MKWGDKDKMICDTCEHVGMQFSDEGEGPVPFCRKDSRQFNPWHGGRGGRGCPVWEPRIDVPSNQLLQ